MHESITTAKAVKANAGPGCEGVFADFVVLYFESGRDFSGKALLEVRFEGERDVFVQRRGNGSKLVLWVR